MSLGSAVPRSHKPLTPAEKYQKEKNFTLDCVAVGSFAVDSANFNPKSAGGIPPYNSRQDKNLQQYFQNPEVKKTLKKTGQWANGGDSINGKVFDGIYKNGTMGTYLKTRNRTGGGYSSDAVAGHQVFMSNTKPMVGYNGAAGYRRNTPSLRNRPNAFEGKR